MNGTLLAVVGVLIAIQLALQITALVQLARTPSDRVTIGGRKWAWALIILLGEIVGSILWFVLGRKPVEATFEPQAGELAAKQSAVDALYGPPEG